MLVYPVSFFQSGTIEGSPSFEWQSNGDINGIAYYLGTNQLSGSWSNPVPNYIEVTDRSTGSNSIVDLGNQGARLFDRNISTSYSVYDEWFCCVDFKNILVKPSKIIFYRGSQTSYIPLEVYSSNQILWTGAKTFLGQFTGANTWLELNPNSSTAFRYFFLRATGSQVVQLNQIEFYGELI